LTRSEEWGKAMILVDDIDKELLENMAWFIGNDGYVRCSTPRNNGVQRTLLLHREIMKPQRANVVDHINGNKLDNRRSNLRIVTRADNNRNTHKGKGYYLHKLSGKFAATFGNKHLGLFSTEVEAKEAHMKAKTEYWLRFERRMG
jgi:hypothetical protein